MKNLTKKRKAELIAEGLHAACAVKTYFHEAGSGASFSKPLSDYLGYQKRLSSKEEKEAFDIGFLYHGSEREATEFKAWSKGYFDGYVACRQEMKADLSKNA